MEQQMIKKFYTTLYYCWRKQIIPLHNVSGYVSVVTTLKIREKQTNQTEQASVSVFYLTAISLVFFWKKIIATKYKYQQQINSCDRKKKQKTNQVLVNLFLLSSVDNRLCQNRANSYCWWQKFHRSGFFFFFLSSSLFFLIYSWKTTNEKAEQKK